MNFDLLNQMIEYIESNLDNKIDYNRLSKITNTNSLSKENGNDTKASIDGKLDVDLKILSKGLGADLSTDIGDVVSKDTSDSERINSVVDVNLLEVINCTKAVIPIKKQN